MFSNALIKAHDAFYVEFYDCSTLDAALSVFANTTFDVREYSQLEMIFLKFCEYVETYTDAWRVLRIFTKRLGRVVVLRNCSNMFKKMILLGDAFDNDFYTGPGYHCPKHTVEMYNPLMEIGKTAFTKAIDCDTRELVYPPALSFSLYCNRFMNKKRSSGIAGFQYDIYHPKRPRIDEENLKRSATTADLECYTHYAKKPRIDEENLKRSATTADLECYTHYAKKLRL